MIVRTIPEYFIDDKPLGRHVEHDPRSKAVKYLATLSTIGSVHHKRHGSLFNQGALGSCTGNATAAALNTEPNYRHATGTLQKVHNLLHEKDAVSIYKLATELDNIDGKYPPEDTGSSGLAACKAAKKLGWLRSYHHAFGLEQALQALQVRPVITGVDWYEGFDEPDSSGLVTPAGQVRGGHEFVITGFELASTANPLLDGIVEADNSWGLNYGLRGRFHFTARTWGFLLEQQGDVTVPIT